MSAKGQSESGNINSLLLSQDIFKWQDKLATRPTKRQQTVLDFGTKAKIYGNVIARCISSYAEPAVQLLNIFSMVVK